MTTPTANPGFAPAPVNSTQWNAQVIEANAQAQQAAISYKAQDPQSDSSLIPDWLSKPVEWVGSKIQSIYSNVISRPLSTIMLAGIESAAATGNAKPTFGVNTTAFSNFFNGNTWDQAYQDAKNVSPGQALTFAFSNFAQGSTNEDLLKNMQKPVMYQMKDATGRPLVDQNGVPVTTNLNATGLIWQNPAAVQQYYSSGAQKWISGGLDAGISWYMDPMALAGKGVGALRDVAYVRPAAETASKTFIGQARQAAFGGLFEKPFVGSAAAAAPVSNVTSNLTSSAFTAMGDLVMDQKAKLGAVQGPINLGGSALPGSTFEDWASRQSWAKNSPQGGALAAQLGKAMNRDQVNQILAVSMGDENAIQKLTAQNADLGAQATMMDRQKNGLISNFPTNPDPATAALQAQQLGDITDSINKIAQQSNDIGDKLNLANALQKGLYFNPTLSPALSAAGQFGRNLQLAKFADLSSAGLANKIGGTLLYNNLYVRPVRAFTGAMWGAIRAPGHIDMTADDSYRALDAGLDQAKVWSPAERQQIVSRYIGSDMSDRGVMLDVTDRATVGRIAAKYGLTDDQAGALYSQIGGMKGAAKDGRIYSTAMIDTPTGGQMRADHVDDAGNLITVSPILSTQLQNTHILTDFEHFDQVLKYNGGAFKRLFAEQELRDRAATGGPLTSQAMQQAQNTALQGVGGTLAGRAYKGVQVGKDMADLMGRLWKFNALLRLGYGPRAIADDFLGQVARHGAYNFFVDRAMDGGPKYFMRKWNNILNDPTGFETMKASLDSGIQDLTQRQSDLSDKIDNINSYLPPAMNYTGKGAKGRALFNARTTNLQQYQQRMDDVSSQLEDLKARRDQAMKTKAALGDRYVIMPDGTAFPRPFEGPQGALFKDLNTGRRTIDSVMGGSATDLWNSFRSNDWQTVTNADKGHTAAWLKDVQYQIANDPAAMKVVRGMDAQQLTKWFGGLEGRQYRAEFGKLKNMSDADHADRIVSHVNMYLPDHTPAFQELRQGVADGADDQTVKNLMEQTETSDRPAVQSEGLAYAMGKSNVIQHMDKMMSGFYEKMNGMPVEALSRNPLFFQLYRQHVSELWQGAKDQGIDRLPVAMQQRMTEQARRLALKDVKKFTFNMDFESKLAHQFRFASPFFGPMQEAFTRWGRIVADKPEIIARNADIYTAPARSGMEVDQNGNPVDKDGYVTNPDGSRTLVAKNNIHIQFQVPTWAQKGLGLDGGTMVDMPLNTLSMVMRNDPWFNPGVGPFVQVPADYVAMKSNPTFGDTLQKLGILQQVTADPMSNVGGSLPKLLSTVFGGGDPAQQQKDMLLIMQAEDYKYKNGLRSTEPTWQEVKDKASNGAMLRSLFKAVLPVSASFTDPYQFFRDRYAELQKADPKTADQIFLAKYGDAAFAFTGALSKSSTGLPSTAQAVMAEKKYQDIIDKDPSLAPLIVGPNAAGNYSSTAYQQQLASGERTKLTAQQSMDAAQANLGWAQYAKYMNQITSGLYQAGFTSFTQKGAEMYANQRKGIIAMLTSPTLPDDKTPNPYYNAQFDQQFNTVDKSKDDRQAAAMQQIVEEGSLVNDPMRADIQGLSQYMVWRTSAKQVLGARQKAGGSDDINAKSNADILQSFHDATMQLIEQNTAFQSLHDRFLSKDMFDHYSPALGTETEGNV